MKTIQKNITQLIIILILTVANSTSTHAQSEDMGIFEASDESVDPGSDPDVPVDGGLSILVAAGGAYVLRRKQTKKEEQKQ